MRKFRKYEFGSQSAATTKINALGEDHGHTIVRLGKIVTTPGTYDDLGEELTAPVLSNNYHVDVLWDGEPDEAWDSAMVWCKPLGVHSFGSSSANKEWVAECKIQRPDLFSAPAEGEDQDPVV